MRFIVRKSDDYSIAIEADNEEAAISQADRIPDDQWDLEKTPLEAEREEPLTRV